MRIRFMPQSFFNAESVVEVGVWMEPTFRHEQIVKGERIGYADLLHLLDG